MEACKHSAVCGAGIVEQIRSLAVVGPVEFTEDGEYVTGVLLRTCRKDVRLAST